MSGTKIIYNGIHIRDCHTLRFEQAVEYDESGTDAVFHRFTIRVAGSVHPETSHAHGVAIPGLLPVTAVDAAIAIQRRLEQTAKPFEYIVGGQVLLKADTVATSPYLDVNNGPKPKVLSITRVAGAALFAIEFEIEVCRVYCDGSQIPPVPKGAGSHASVLNNRWSYAEERDKDFYSLRVLEGTLRVRSIKDMPHLFRWLCVPPLQKGYQRESMQFIDSPDGLTLKYRIVDRQKYAAPPAPATEWEAVYQETSGVGGAVGFGEMNVKLKGPPEVDKKELLEAATNVVKARLGSLHKSFANAGEQKSETSPLYSAVIEHMHENVVQIVVRALRVETGKSWLHVFVENMGKPLEIKDYDPKKWLVPKLYDGSTPVGIYAKYLQSPCSPIHGVPSLEVQIPDKDDAGEDDQVPGEVEIYESPEPIEYDEPNGIGSTHQGGFPYTYVKLENRYDMRDGVMHLPIARWGGSSVPAGIQPTAVAIPIHGTVGKRTIIAHCERVGDQPELPPPLKEFVDPNGIKHHRTWQKLHTEAPELMADGKTKLYKAQFQLDYAMDRAPLEIEVFASGSTPTEAGSPADNRLEGSKVFANGIYF